MSWRNPWVTRSGVVSSVGVTGPHGVLGGYYTTRFRLDGRPVRYLGKPALLCDGDRAIVVGWAHRGELHACFVAVPDWGWFFRSHSAAPDFVWGGLMLFLAGLLIAKVAVLPGIAVAGVAAMLIFHAVAWLDGERLARTVFLQQISKF